MNCNRTCFLSPHSDDTFLELYMSIKKRVLPGEYYLCTIFSESNYVDAKHSACIDKSTISYLRQNEDRVFADDTNMKYLTLNIPDCLLRLGTVYYDNCELDHALIEVIFYNLCKDIKQYNIDNIVAPLPYGEKQHYDHRILCEVAKRINKIEKVNVMWTNDCPYSKVPYNLINKVLWHNKLTQKDIEKKSSKLDEIYPTQTCEYYKEAIETTDEMLFTL